MKKLQTFKTIDLPHLYFKIHFMDLSKLQGLDLKGGAGYTCTFEDDSATIFIKDIEKSVKDINAIPVIAHEIIHALQIICEKYQMRFENEQEHMAYIMYHCLNELIK